MNLKNKSFPLKTKLTDFVNKEKFKFTNCGVWWFI